MFARLALVALLVALAWGVVARSSSGASHERAYVVRPADTLWSIASEHYGGDPREGVWRLRQRNGLRDTILRPGERLIVP